MADDIIDSRGRFWSAEIPVPERHFAPESSVTGRLRLGTDGRTQLDLDATIDLTGSRKDAVDLLYHALILQIIGVPEALVRRRFISGPHSYSACLVLAHVGLHVPAPPPLPTPN